MIIAITILAIIAVGVFVVLTEIVRIYQKKYNVAMTEQDSYYAKEYKNFIKGLKFIRFIVCVISSIIIALILILNSIRIVDQTEIGVVRTFGQISGTIDGGLNFVNPLTDTVAFYDTKVHKQEREFASYTMDAQPVAASTEFQYELHKERIIEVASEYGSYESLEDKLGNMVEERVKIVLAKYSAMTLLENRSNLSTEVSIEVEKLEDIYPINFTSIIIRDVAFSDAFEESVEAKMTAEQNALKAEQDKKTAVIKAEQEREVAAIEAEAAISKAEGEAKAMQITREALQNMPNAYIQQMWIEKWNGELPTVQSGEGVSVIVNPNITNATE